MTALNRETHYYFKLITAVENLLVACVTPALPIVEIDLEKNNLVVYEFIRFAYKLGVRFFFFLISKWEGWCDARISFATQTANTVTMICLCFLLFCETYFK